MSDRDLKLQVIFSMMEKVTAPLKKIIGTSESGGKALKAMRDKLKDLESQQVAVSGFRKIHGDLRETSSKLETAEQHVKSLAQKMRLVEAPTRAMTREFDKATKAAKQLKEQHQSQSLQLQGMRDKLKAAGISTHELGKAQQWLKNNIAYTNAEIKDQIRKLEAATKKQEQLATAKKRMERSQAVAGKMAMTGAGMVAAGTVAAVSLKSPISAFANAEDSKVQLKVSMMQEGGKVSPEFEKINELATKLGDRLPGTTSDFLDMMTMLNRQGMSGQAILGGMGEASAYLAVQLKKLPTEAAEFAAKMQDATRTNEKDMLKLMDVIQRTYYLGVDDNNMLEAFTKVSPALRTLRQEGLEAVNTIAPMIAMFDQAGMKGEAGGNALRKVLDLGMDKAKRDKVNKILAPKGIKLDFSDGKGEFAGIENMFTQFAKLKSLNNEETLKAMGTQFGDDGETKQVLEILITKGKAGYEETIQKMKNQASLQMRVNEQLGTLKNRWEATTGTFTNTLSVMGETIEPELKKLTMWLGEVAQSTSEWVKENPVLASTLMKAAAIVAVLLIGLGGLALVLSVLGNALAVARYAMMVFNLTLLMNPIFLIVAAVMALIAVCVYLYNTWAPVTRFFDQLWTDIKLAFKEGLWGITKLIISYSPIGMLHKAFGAVWNFFDGHVCEKMTGYGGKLIDWLVDAIKSKIQSLRDTFISVNKMAMSILLGASAGEAHAKKLEAIIPNISTPAITSPIAENTNQANLTSLPKFAPNQSYFDIYKAGAIPKISPDQLPFDASKVGDSSKLLGLTPAPEELFKIDQRPALSPSKTNTNVTHNTNQITINTLPGMDAQTIARLVKEELDKQTRKNQISKRSSLHDYDES
ncbi:phage tail tape measure protein [Undibacterium danionis]|uniref:Phage tail tape measure protein n=1 Tax=Undibacterium danionis TaxID=1812100 RepID=A0ABV6ILG5_9BURK